MAIPAILIREETNERRLEERWRVRLGARWLDGGPEAQSLTILDLSSSGILLETDQALETGSHLIVEISGEVAKICKIVWASGRLFGATFSEALSDAELQGLISSSSVVWPRFGAGTQAAPIKRPVHPSPEDLDDRRVDEEEKLPVAMRFMIIIGVSAALWALIGVGIWLDFR